MSVSREAAIAVMSLELQKHPEFTNVVDSVDWATRLFDAIPSVELEDSPIAELQFWVQHYDAVNEARWGDDDKDPPKWENVIAELGDGVGLGKVSWEFWHSYVQGTIIDYARSVIRDV